MDSNWVTTRRPGAAMASAPRFSVRKPQLGIIYTGAASTQQAQATGKHRSHRTRQQKSQLKQIQNDNKAASDTSRNHKLCFQTLFFIATIVFYTLYNPHRVLIAQHSSPTTNPASLPRLPNAVAPHPDSRNTLTAPQPSLNDAPRRCRCRTPPTTQQFSLNTANAKTTWNQPKKERHRREISSPAQSRVNTSPPQVTYDIHTRMLTTDSTSQRYAQLQTLLLTCTTIITSLPSPTVIPHKIRPSHKHSTQCITTST